MAEQANSKEFNPNDHLLDLRGKDYLPVAWRIYWLRQQHPEAQLTTELIEQDEKHAIFKAKVYVSGKEAGELGAMATGYGSETVDDFGDFLEKAETKAIGRALAALGFGTQFCSDFDEGGSVTDAPLQRKGRQKADPRYDGYRKAAPQKDEAVGAARHALRAALTAKFGTDEEARWDFMKEVEPTAIKGAAVDYSAISGERCHDIIAIISGAAPAEPEMTPEEMPG